MLPLCTFPMFRAADPHVRIFVAKPSYAILTLRLRRSLDRCATSCIEPRLISLTFKNFQCERSACSKSMA